NEYLVTFGDGYRYNASGKWDIHTNSSSTLDLIDKFDGNRTSNLGFAVGNNYRQDSCEEGVEWVANVYPDSQNYTINDDGSGIVNIEYDYYLVGKDVMFWVNIVGKQYSIKKDVKIGESRKITLRGQGLKTATHSFAKGDSSSHIFEISIANTVEYLRNSNFNYNIQIEGGTASTTAVSMVDLTDCSSDGVSFVKVDFQAKDENTSGTINLINLVISNEF
ncbi:MAG: hypothetical protein U9P38_05340, partial [Campylobacterota bacterium]|nr:hypothetical protein [Campylobacterota bacterium]